MMSIIDVPKTGSKRYEGIDWRDVAGPISISPYDVLLCCDLRGVNLDGLDLSRVRFLGCRLDGTSFREATLRWTRFVGCFSSPQGPPTDFRGCVWDKTWAGDSHLYALSDHQQAQSSQWSSDLVEAATNTLSIDNNVRARAAKRIGQLGDPVAALLTGCLLADREWEVRLFALIALAQLRGASFPHEDVSLLEWMFLRLGDEHSLVRQETRRLVKDISPPDGLLRVCIARIMAEPRQGHLAGLRAVLQLAEFVDKRYATLIDLETIDGLLTDEVPEVRIACLNILALRDDDKSRTLPKIRRALHDPAPSVRVAALQALDTLNAPQPAFEADPVTFKSLLADRDETVRLLAQQINERIGS